jgi:two-component system, LytTR family, sensor kinase
MKNKTYWQCQIYGWGIVFVYECFTNYCSNRNLAKEIPLSLLSAFLGILFTHIYRVFVLKKIKWSVLPFQSLVFRMLLSSLVIGTILSIYQCVQAVLITQERSHFQFYFFLVFFINLFSFALNWNLIYFMLKYIENNKKLSTEKIEIQLLNKNLELTNIKLNLQPHFIFNALNSIRSLIIENQEKARDGVMQLSNILRNSLINDKAELVVLQSELNLVSDYLSLEAIRYEERLVVHYNIDATCNKTLIPPMLLQTLVENAIKHGIAVSDNGGSIWIHVYNTIAEFTTISIENTGQYITNKNHTSTGFGLESSKQRLLYLYGNKASLTITNTTHNTVITILQIPN